MINLLNSELIKHIISSCPQRDGYELENLLEDSDTNLSFLKKYF